jgi:hypothetical protein
MTKNISNKREWKMNSSNGGGAVYGMGFVGALFYFLQHAGSFSSVVMGVLKAIVWPALLVFKALELFKW